MTSPARPILLPCVLLLITAAAACVTAGPAAQGSRAAGAEPPRVADPAPRARTGAGVLAEGEAALARSDFRRAEALLAEAEQVVPGPRATALRARAVLHQARFDEALAIARAADEKGETAEARLVEGRVLAIRRELEAAARAFERVTVLAPRDAEAWSALAGARLATGDQRGGEAAFAEAVKLLGVDAAEDRLWNDIARMRPDPYQIEEAQDRCARGTAAVLAGKYADARHEIRAVVSTIPAFAHCWSEMGKAEWKLGELATAEDAFRKALAAYRPDQAGLRADTEGLLAALLVERGARGAEAVALARSAVARRGPRPALVETLARACALAPDAECARDTVSASSR